ncbi:MAG: monofunctional biosynthetic peptidoglycan transglycosylase [Bacteroidota bacterium]
MKKALVFIRNHKTLSFFLFIALLVVLQIAVLPFADVAELRTKNPNETAFMQAQADEAKSRGTIFRKRQRWISLKALPNSLVDAVIVAEDGTFWSHGGFDWYEFRESLEKNVSQRRAARGASTITQQLAKNLYLSASKNPLRKLKEWILTWYMERTLSKSRILELYLNLIEWGDGIYGVDAASRYYFGKSASELNRGECTRLAAIIPSPRRHRADENSSYVLRRAAIILARMEARGMVSLPSDTLKSGSLPESLEFPVEDADTGSPISPYLQIPKIPSPDTTISDTLHELS